MLSLSGCEREECHIDQKPVCKLYHKSKIVYDKTETTENLHAGWGSRATCEANGK